MTYCCTLLLYEANSRPRRASHVACDLGALGGTRTPNLLIRRSVHHVRPVPVSPLPQVIVHRSSCS